jgi:hypothetical protein
LPLDGNKCAKAPAALSAPVAFKRTHKTYRTVGDFLTIKHKVFFSWNYQYQTWGKGIGEEDVQEL